MSTIDRRKFVSTALAAAFTPFVASARQRGPSLRIGLLSSGADARDRHDGALLGVEEARHAAELFGGTITFVAVKPTGEPPESLSAILGDDSFDNCRRLAAEAHDARFLFMNIGCDRDELRGALCSPFTFHVAPSDAMLRDALRQASGATAIVAWGGTLVRFGADTLNDRYRQRFGRSMTPAAWQAWFAVKALWESSLRMKSAEPRRLAEYLVRDTTQFDGHKGRPLSFRAWDHQLRQFVYARIGGKLVDVPQSATPETTSREFLDKLGTSASATACHLI